MYSIMQAYHGCEHECTTTKIYVICPDVYAFEGEERVDFVKRALIHIYYSKASMKLYLEIEE